MNIIKFTKRGFITFLKEKKNLKEVVTVKNINHGTDQNTNYINQWETYTGKSLCGCANINCENHASYDALVGGHVKIMGDTDNRWYITPLCHSCNGKDEFEMVVYKENLALLTEIKVL